MKKGLAAVDALVSSKQNNEKCKRGPNFNDSKKVFFFTFSCSITSDIDSRRDPVNACRNIFDAHKKGIKRICSAKSQFT
jgi:hypothetical protein